MTCEEFQIVSLDLGGSPTEIGVQQVAREHLRECPHCAAFQRNWMDLRTDLHAIGEENRYSLAPSRVEMRLRQEFRNQNKTWQTRQMAQLAAWGLAAAAVLVGLIGWINWRNERVGRMAQGGSGSAGAIPEAKAARPAVVAGGPELGEVLVAANHSGDFTLLPGSMPGFLGDATVVHVQMQRAALGSLGLTVNEEHAGDWIQVDLLLGDDGQPQAVRLPEAEN